MVPILSGIIVGSGAQAKNIPSTRSRGFILALAYSLGMITVYTLLGIAAGLLGNGLASIMQKPIVISFFALMIFLMSLSMFDIYQLQMNPKNADQYMFDGVWTDLEKKKIKLHIKGIPIPVSRDLYWSKYGATMKNEQGTFAIRLGANMEIRALEQWYTMNKAQNFTQFYKAISMQGLSMFNIMYADRNDTIFYVNNIT
mgnify:CR=1 FL=1